jgi:hypothetical protein
VTVVEYGDFECPFCGQAELVLRELLRDFTDVRYVWRHLPLTDVHVHAQLAAQAAEAAAEQSAFWEMRDLLLDRQDALNADDLIHYAGQLGLGVEHFTNDLRKGSALRASPTTSTAPTSAASTARRRSSSTAAATTALTTSRRSPQPYGRPERERCSRAPNPDTRGTSGRPGAKHAPKNTHPPRTGVGSVLVSLRQLWKGTPSMSTSFLTNAIVADATGFLVAASQASASSIRSRVPGMPDRPPPKNLRNPRQRLRRLALRP